MDRQLRPVSGNSFFDLSHISWEDLKVGHPPYHRGDWWVRWQDREWLCKRKEESLNEILGYQLAQQIGLPIQPWAAFFQRDKSGHNNFRLLSGILIERWPNAAPMTLGLECPAISHPDLVGKALALAAMDRGHDSEWLVDANNCDLRLSDLEGVGPLLVWPCNDEFVRLFQRDAQLFYEAAADQLHHPPVRITFKLSLCELLRSELTDALDFSGHPDAEIITHAASRGIAGWQSEVRCRV